MRKQCVLFLSSLLLGLPVLAQNTGGVFPPMVNEGHKSLQYRIAVDPDNSAGETGYAQRLHYQQAINDDYMWRIIAQSRKTDSSDTDFDFVQAELFVEVGENNSSHRKGLRFDVRVRDGDRPNQIGINWMSQFYFDDGWSARALGLAALQVGNNADDAVDLQVRFQVAKKVAEKHTLGVEMYNSLGNTDDFGNLSDRSQTIGPIWQVSTGSGWSFFSGLLFGITDVSPDTEARLWITKSFK